MTTFTKADVIDAYVSQLRAKGLSNNEIKTALMDTGYENKVNTNYLQKKIVMEHKDAASSNMTAGALYLLAGILIAVITYLTPLTNFAYGLTYIALLVGCIRFIKGFMQSV